MPYTVEGVERIARTLRDYEATCTCLTETEADARALFAEIRQITPVVGVVSRTGKTLHLGVLTENPNKYGNNQRINLQTHLNYVKKVFRTEAERVLT